jgi:hypothetical protein
MDTIYIYKYLDKDNIPIYIGMGKKTRAYDHLKAVNYPKSKNTYFYSKLRKLMEAKEDINIEILHENLSREEACEIEKYYIAFYGRKCLKLGTLYNLAAGGDGGPSGIISKETRLKRSKSLTGKKRTEKQKLEMSLAMRGKKHKKFSEEAIKNRSIAIQKTRNVEGISKFKKTMFQHFSTKICRIDKQGERLIFNTQYDALDSVDGDLPSRIIRCCIGVRKSYKGYKWEYVTN